MTEHSSAVTAWEALFRAQVTILRHLGSDFPVNDLSFNEYDVVFNLSQQPGRRARLRSLNELLLISQPSISRLVDRLVTRGIVTKAEDPHDARGVLVELTDEGYRTFVAVARLHMERIEARVGGVLTPEELSTLTALCTKLRLAEK